MTKIELEGKFKTPAWKGKFEPGSSLCKLLEALPESSEGEINTESLIILGCLWCEGSLADKADILIKLANPPPHPEDKGIAADDKDFSRILDKWFRIANHLTYS